MKERLAASYWLRDSGRYFASGLVLVFGSLIATGSIQAALVNRWAFNSTGNATAGTVFIDSIGGVPMAVVGNNATLSGTSITLPGTTNGNQLPSAISAYLDLPNGIVSGKANLTLEIWATPLANNSWARLFDFGRMSRGGMGAGAAPGEIRPNATALPGGSTEPSDTLRFAMTRGTTANTQQLEGRLDGGTTISSQTGETLNVGTRYHFVFVFADGAGSSGASGGQLRWYLNGTLVTTVDVPFKLQNIEDVNNWLGRSQSSSNSNIHASYDEVRLYDHALTPAEVSANFVSGPNAVGPATALADSQTMHRLQKALIPVLANDSGALSPATVTVTTPPQFGLAVPDGAGRILYTSTSSVATTDQFSYSVGGNSGTSNPAPVTITFSNQLRITPPALNVPASPPTTAVAIVDAFPGLTFNLPLHLATPPGETRRLFVCEKAGLLRVIPDVTASTTTATTFLDLPAVLAAAGETLTTTSECGLLSVAFHPNYATNRFFYVYYSVNTTGGLHQRVSRFTASATNPNAADPASQLILLQQRDEANNHNGGDMVFGPDGYLYISTGDEGGQNDVNNNSQTITKDFFCAILRIDVDRLPANLEPNAHPAIPTTAGVARYKIPAGNPFVGATSFNGVTIADPTTIRTEFWATGFRNPWRMSFDSATGDLYVGDVGGGQREEVNVVTRGGNYGWATREGTVAGPKSSTQTALGALNPLYEYSHGDGSFQGRSITGGVFARNNRFSILNDTYFFSDYVSGNVWSLRRNGAAVNVERVAGEGSVSAFGRDPSNNDVLMAKLTPGSIRRLVAATVTESFPQTLADTRLFADLTDLSPAPGVLPYVVNRTFWSDFAEKRRWFVLPDPATRLTWSSEGTWGAPTGGVWIKHFDMEMTRGNPATRKRLETRLLVRNSAGSYGVSYRWNDAGTVATLAPDEGVDFPLNVSVNGVIAPQVWSIPSRASCIICHNAPAGHMLSFKTRQLNQAGSINGFAGNQIDLLAGAGYFHNDVPPSNTLPRHIRPAESGATVASHVRSYLEVNCAYCHMPGGTAPSNWDAREITPLAGTGLLNGIANNAGGNPLNRLVVPGSPGLSVLLKRVAASDGFGRMPPIASNVLDAEAIAQIQDWIANSLPNRQTYATWRVQKFGAGGGGINGEQGANPDGDSATNQSEYLIGTEPNSGASFPNASVMTDGDQITISLSVPADRLVWIETSTDLVTWTRWNVPDNNGLSGSAGLRSFTGPLLGNRQFFRPVVSED